jgi:hypothetical protein
VSQPVAHKAAIGRKRGLRLVTKSWPENVAGLIAAGGDVEISPAERVKINALIFRLGLKEVPSDTNVMAWVLPSLEAAVRRFEGQDARLLGLEKRLKELELRFPG